jgi:protein-L-isoaspartate(D-aspartate) O-methyltransferase
MLENTDQSENFLKQKWDRAAVAIKWSDLTQPKVIEAFLYTPREYFCREKNRLRAYEHTVLDIGYGQTISGPHCVAKMTDELELEPQHRVMEIGTGSGYQSAVLAQLSNWVYTIEVIEPLAQETELIYQSLEKNYPELKNIHHKIADGYYGWEEYAPFDRIIVTCGIDHKPPPLLKQLAVDGIMLIPVGPPMGQHVLKIRKTMNADGSIKYTERDIYNGMVVPFVNFTVDGKTRHSVERDKPGT